VTALSGEVKLAQVQIAGVPPARNVSLKAGQPLAVHTEAAFSSIEAIEDFNEDV